MILYEFKCSVCGHEDALFCKVEDRDASYDCPLCGNNMKRKISCPHGHDGRDYSRQIVSDSLAVSMSQIEEHKKMFPNIKMTPEGQPVFDNYRDHENYLKETGFVKAPGKKKKGKRIA